MFFEFLNAIIGMGVVNLFLGVTQVAIAHFEASRKTKPVFILGSPIAEWAICHMSAGLILVFGSLFLLINI